MRDYCAILKKASFFFFFDNEIYDELMQMLPSDAILLCFYDFSSQLILTPSNDMALIQEWDKIKALSVVCR